jgi:isovaleryl-CoA dehydrogenase
MAGQIPTLEFGLGNTVKAVQEGVRAFAQREIAPLAAQIDRTHRIPRAVWRSLGDLDLLGVSVEDEFGGVGLGYIHQLITMEELSRASASVGMSYGAHVTLCMNQIRRHGSPAQKRRYLPRLVSGEHVGALAMSETEAGSDVVSMRLLARRDGDDYVLNGQKQWITNGSEADIIVVYAKTRPEAGSKGITAFIVEAQFEGFSTGRTLDKLGMHGTGTCELVFEGCRVPIDNVLGQKMAASWC